MFKPVHFNKMILFSCKKYLVGSDAIILDRDIINQEFVTIAAWKFRKKLQTIPLL